MIKQEITYKDFNGDTHTKEPFYFNLNKVEAAEIIAGFNGKTVEEAVAELVADDNLSKMITFIKNIILKSYGRRSKDGKRFEKSPEISQEFASSNAFAELFEKIMSEKGGSGTFINGLIASPVSDSGKSGAQQHAFEVLRAAGINPEDAGIKTSTIDPKA